MAVSSPVLYDFAIVGAGVSGLTLAHHLLQHLAADQTLLVIDRDVDPDYNVSFWTDEPIPFRPIMHGNWKNVQVRYGDLQRTCPLDRYALRAFWRADFDEFMRAEIFNKPNFHFRDAGVTGISDCGDHAEIATHDDVIRARWIFDSRSNLAALRKNDPNLLLMQGLAWEIEVVRPRFDPETATLFDFLLDTPEFDFVYVLPYTDRYALVNCAYVTPFKTKVDKETCEQTLTKYLSDRLTITDYRIVKSCYGRIPLSAHPQRRKRGSRIIPIGVRGGMVKSTTSYAFTRILADAQQVVHALERTGQPYYSDRRPWYYRAADRRMVKVFRKAPDLAQEIMFHMFSESSGDLSLAFLDEKNSLRQNMELFKIVPRPLLRRFLRVLLNPFA